MRSGNIDLVITDASRRTVKTWQVAMALGIAAFAISSYDNQYPRWWYLSLLLAAAILILQFTNLQMIRAYALWVGLFNVAQSILSAYLIDPNFLTLLPRQQYTLEPAGQLPGVEGVQRISTDSKGFRTTLSVDYEANAGFRIYAIGGSTTEQLVLDDRRTFTHMLQAPLTKELGINVEVINTGVSGLRAKHHKATLRHVLKFHPDLAIILLGVNDWNRHIHLQYPDQIPDKVVGVGYPDWQRGIRFRNTMLGKLGVAAQMRLHANGNGKQSELSLSFEPGDSLRRPEVRSFKPTYVAPEYAHNLTELFDLCETSGVPCLFATQPNAYKEHVSEQLKQNFWMTPPYAKYTLDLPSMIHIAALYNNFLIQEARKRKFPVCDLDSHMEPTFASFFDDVHFNSSGAEQVFKLLLPCVKQLIEDHRGKTR